MITPEVKKQFIEIERSLQQLVDLVDSIPEDSKTVASEFVHARGLGTMIFDLHGINMDITDVIERIKEHNK